MKQMVIDADGHIIEHDAQIFQYLEEPYRSRDDLLNAPFFPSLDGWNRAARRVADRKGKSMPSPDAKTWLAFLDDAHVELSVLYPTQGLAYGLIKDREWATVLARAYNNFLYGEFLKAAPKRLKGIALIPLQDIQEAVKELRRAVTELGMVGAVLPAVGLRRPFGESYYDPVYNEAQRLGCMLAVHGAPAQGLGFDFFERLVEARALSHPFSQMIQLTSMVMNGVFERFPTLRVSYMEAGSGWIPFMMERLDREFRNRAASISTAPSKQLRSGHVFFHCELDEAMLPVAVKAVGEEQFFCASDFPHEATHEYIETLEEFRMRADLTESAKAKILIDNPKRLYRL